MSFSRFWYFLLVALALALALVATFGASSGVGQDGYYEAADITVDPSSQACIGGTITLSSAGAPAGSPITVGMEFKVPGGYPAAQLGNTTADAAGNWVLTATVPHTSMTGEPSPTPTPIGEWSVVALGDDYTAVGDLTVLECRETLPATGSNAALPVAAAVVLILALAVSFVRIMKGRRSTY